MSTTQGNSERERERERHIDQPQSQEADNKKTPQSTNKFGAKFSVIIAVLMLLAIAASSALAVKQQYKSELDTEYESLANALFAVNNLFSFEDSLQRSYESFDLNEGIIFTDVAKVYFDYTGVTAQTLSDYAERMGDCAIFYFPASGDVIVSDNADEFPLDDDQFKSLKTVGAFQTDDNDYTAARVNDGWLCIQWVAAQELYTVDFQRILETCPSKLCIIEDSTGEVLASSDYAPYDFLDESQIVNDTERRGHEADGIQAGTFGGTSPISGVYFERINLLDRYSVFAYVERSTVLSSALRKIAPEFFFMALCFVFIWFCAMRLRKKGADILDQQQCIQFTKNYYVNMPVCRHVTTLLLIGALATSAIAAYLPLLNSYTEHNGKMENNLNAFVNEMQLSDEEWEKVSVIFYELVTDRVQMIADMKEMMGDEFGIEELAELARDMEFVSVVVYDENGEAVMSTDGYTGYTLTQNTEDDEYAAWNLLHSTEVSMMSEKADGSGYYAAVRRTDAPGLIFATLTNSALSAIRNQTDVNAALLRVNTDSYGKIYISAEDPETMYWATSSGTKVRAMPNTLSENALLASFYGTGTIGGHTYYLNTMTNDEHIIISAEQTETLTRPVIGILANILPGVILISLVILFMSCLYREIDDWLHDETDNLMKRIFAKDMGEVKEQDQALDMELNRMSRRLLILLFVALIVLYFLDALLAENSVASYLFSNQWEHKFGIFSVTTILMSVAFAVIGIAILKKLMGVLSGKLNSRMKTISNLFASIVQFVVIVVVAIYALFQLGVDTTVILTSAGVLTLIIGYGSQSIVSDLVSGLFLIMEDQVRIGEVIEIDGFLGTVTQMGLRTTKAEYFNRAKVINNSKMVGFYNLSRDTSAAHWTIGIPVDQDIEEVKMLILHNTDRFKEALGDRLTNGPIYVGVDRVDSDYFGYHFILHFLSVCDVAYWVPVRTRSFEVACKILVENGIKPTGGQLLNT